MSSTARDPKNILLKHLFIDLLQNVLKANITIHNELVKQWPLSLSLSFSVKRFHSESRYNWFDCTLCHSYYRTTRGITDCWPIYEKFSFSWAIRFKCSALLIPVLCLLFCNQFFRLAKIRLSKDYICNNVWSHRELMVFVFYVHNIKNHRCPLFYNGVHLYKRHLSALG